MGARGDAEVKIDRTPPLQLKVDTEQFRRDIEKAHEAIRICRVFEFDWTPDSKEEWELAEFAIKRVQTFDIDAECVTLLKPECRRKWTLSWRFPFLRRVWDVTYRFEVKP